MFILRYVEATTCKKLGPPHPHEGGRRSPTMFVGVELTLHDVELLEGTGSPDPLTVFWRAGFVAWGVWMANSVVQIEASFYIDC